MARPSAPAGGNRGSQGASRARPYVEPRGQFSKKSSRTPPEWRTPPTKRGGGFWGLISFIASTAIVLGALALVAVFAFVADVSRPGPSTAEASFIVERGASAGAIGDALAQRGIVRNATMFRLATRAYANAHGLQAGEYDIPAGASVRAIVQQMADGHVVQHNVTVAEGLTSAQVVDILAHTDLLTGDPPPAPPEGSVMPETYQFQRGMTRAALLQQMRDARDAAVAEIWARRAPNLPITTPEEAVTLASIVERETGVPGERPRVAAVFTNRLRIHMPLQTDPTVIYGVCLRAPTHCRNGRLINERTGEPRVIRESELAMRTGYNTYQIQGLPPTPIANPGRASLEAVVNPAPTNDLYFVADGTGGHAFAATVADHQRNVARWRQIEAQRLAEERAHATAAAQQQRTPTPARP